MGLGGGHFSQAEENIKLEFPSELSALKLKCLAAREGRVPFFFSVKHRKVRFPSLGKAEQRHPPSAESTGAQVTAGEHLLLL